MNEEPRLVLWLDILIASVAMILVLAQKWDWVIALVIGLVVMNYFDRWWARHR